MVSFTSVTAIDVMLGRRLCGDLAKVKNILVNAVLAASICCFISFIEKCLAVVDGN